MDLATKIEFLNRAIASQRTTLRLQIGLAGLLIALGVALVTLALLKPGLVLPASLSGGQTLGGAVVSASSFVPIFSTRRDKIAALFFLMQQYQRQHAQGPDAAEIERLDQRFWQLLDKNLGG